MVAPVAAALIIIVVIAVILYVITMTLFITTANKLDGTEKSTLLAAGAMIGIAIPLIVVGAIFGMLHFGELYRGKKKPLYMWMFIIVSSIAAALIFIASIIGWVYGARLEGSQRRNVQAAAALSLVGAGAFAIAFVMMVILAKQKIPGDVRAKIKSAKAQGKSYEYTEEDKVAMRKGMGSYLKSGRSSSY